MTAGGHVRRRGAVLMAALALAGATTAPAVIAPDDASAAVRLAYGGTSQWYWKWETTRFAVSGPGVVDIWTTCRPRRSDVTWHELLIGQRRINVPCDRRGHWVRRVGIPRNTWLTVLAHPFMSNSLFCYWNCATGWTSVHTAS
jgi:hypothetical protein